MGSNFQRLPAAIDAGVPAVAERLLLHGQACSGQPAQCTSPFGARAHTDAIAVLAASTPVVETRTQEQEPFSGRLAQLKFKSEIEVRIDPGCPDRAAAQDQH